MKKSLLLYLDQKEVFDTLTNEQAGVLIKAIFQYESDKTQADLDPMLKIIFIPIRQAIDRNTERYDNVCKRNAENIGKRWNRENTKNTTGKSGIPEIPNDTRNTNSDSNSNSDKDRNKDNNTIGLRPDVFQVSNYFMEIGLDDFTAQAQARLYINHYTSNGWKVGKNSMKDWRAAARGWKERIKTYKNGTHQPILNGSKPEKLGRSERNDIARANY